MVTFELFGIPRFKAQRETVTVQAAHLGGAVRALAAACPRLEGTVLKDGRLVSGYVVSINGEHMTTDPKRKLLNGDVLVLMSAQAGG